VALFEEKLDEALDYLQTAVRLNPEDPTVHANLGETLLRKAQFNEAAIEFEKALKLDPDDRDPGANRARGILQGMQAAIKEMDRLNKLADSGKGATV
jgi:Flp pilus assembly protein TadD